MSSPAKPVIDAWCRACNRVTKHDRGTSLVEKCRVCGNWHGAAHGKDQRAPHQPTEEATKMQYVVELTGECREVYIVEAASEQEARENWASGWHQITEAQGMEVVSVRLDDDGDPEAR